MTLNNKMLKQSPNPPSLPSIRERLPELQMELGRALDYLEKSANHSYLPAWIPLYEKTHSLKGLTRLLPCTEELREDLILLSDTVGEAHHGAFAPRDRETLKLALQEISAALSASGRLVLGCETLKKSYSLEAPHEERLRKIPQPIQRINPIVSKKAFEAVRANLPMWILEETMVLGDYTDWSRRVHACMAEPEGPHGFVIHLAPHLISGASAALEAMAWFALEQRTGAALADSLPKIFPRAHLRPCPA